MYIDLIVGSLPLAAPVAHHYYLAILFMISPLLIRNLKLSLLLCIVLIELTNLGSHLILSINLITLLTNSMLFDHHSYPIPTYPFPSIDYTPLVRCFGTISILVAY